MDSAQEERVLVLSEWPQPAAGAPEPRIKADDTSLSLLYRTGDEHYAVVRFPLYSYLIFGAPNDEALGGHPLSRCGLRHYSVHEVHGSKLIRELEKRNSVHPRHDSASYLNARRHYIFTFHDTTLECVVAEPWGAPTVTVFEQFHEAELAWLAPRQT